LLIAGFKSGPLRAEDASSIGITEPSIATNFAQNGDGSGTRKWLYDHGISYNLIYTNDVLSNLSGGIRRGCGNRSDANRSIVFMPPT
jgi:carbohydrate-selective porin OprB